MSYVPTDEYQCIQDILTLNHNKRIADFCCILLYNKSDIVSTVCMCKVCAKDTKTCPMCRSNIIQIVEVFFS